MDVLYSLLDVDNQRLNMIVQEKTFTNTLNFVVTTINDEVLSIANPTIDRFCIDILPKIGYNIKSLILEAESVERILRATDYPNLTELKLYNVNDEIVSQYLIVKSPFGRLFQEQITDLILVYNDDILMLSMNPDTICIYEYSLQCFKNLKHLSIIGCPRLLIINDLPSTTWLSLNLNKLRVDICDFEDCFGLLDGRLKQLTTLIVEVIRPQNDLSTTYNMNNLPNMKCFSLTCHCPTNEYDTRVVPLLRRMIALEELSLNIINNQRTSLIDGTQINDKILVYMPNLRKFIFYINTKVELHHLTHYPSNEDIQRTFTNIGYEQVCCTMHYFIDSIACHIFSLPFVFNYVEYIGNTFPSIDFSSVRELLLDDTIPFEHEFFIRIARFFPLLKTLHVMNDKLPLQMRSDAISDIKKSHSTVEYPYLTSLDLSGAHIGYVEQFLNQNRTRLPRLNRLVVDYAQLRFVTKDFTRNATRKNCAQVKQLDVEETIVHSKAVYDYFPLL